jgi:hypothetical protein
MYSAGQSRNGPNWLRNGVEEYVGEAGIDRD